MGAPAFVARSRELAANCGPRFEPAQVVVEQAARGGRFSDTAGTSGMAEA
jgi:3-hydroxyacyl-CoA dehydrogenase/enoyl-CoA hydratase/3-hydroxybutyryl-CoA epimerase